MPFEFIDRLVMVMRLWKDAVGCVGPHPRRFTAVSRRLKAQIEAPLVDFPRYHVETSRYGVRDGPGDGS